MAFKVTYQDQALIDLEESFEWSREHHPDTTERFAGELFDHLDLVTLFPEMAPSNDFEMYPHYLDAKGLWLTGNTTTIYAAAILDLAKDGPVVVEVPPGPAAGMFGDYWFVTTGVGALGPDKGHGGKFLLVPPGYKGDLPTEGYFVTPSRMNDSTFFIRGMVVNGDVEAAVALLKKARIYPYSERDSPKPNRFFDVSNITSYDKLKLNDDGSTDLYFGPKAPAGLESNWVDTNASKGWFAWFRFYGPTETFFSKTWQLSDFEPEK